VPTDHDAALPQAIERCKSADEILYDLALEDMTQGG
jgi:hypothetical protein